MSITYKLPESSNLKVGDRVDFLGGPIQPTKWYQAVYNKIYYYCFSRFGWYERSYNIKQFLQRRLRGYSDSECYDFYHHHSEYCIVRLKKLKEYGNSHPCDVADIKTWHAALDEMIWAFEFSRTDPYDYLDEKYPIGDYIVTSIADNEVTINQADEKGFKKAEDIAFKAYKQDQKRFLKAMKLFGKHYNSLWD